MSGLGTMISACFDKEFNTTQFCYGFFQFIFTPLFIGWILAIYSGVLIFKKGERGADALLK